jgi:hypothetical protein
LSDENKVKHDDLADDVVHSPEIKKGEVKASDIAKAAVRSGEIQDGKVKAADLARATTTATSTGCERTAGGCIG